MLTRLDPIRINGLDLIHNSLQLAGTPSSHGPPKIRWQALSDMLYSQLSSITRGTEDHKVILARC